MLHVTSHGDIDTISHVVTPRLYSLTLPVYSFFIYKHTPHVLGPLGRLIFWSKLRNYPGSLFVPQAQNKLPGQFRHFDQNVRR